MVNNILIELISMLFEFSLIVFFILLGRKWVLRTSGPVWTYRLWYIPIAYLVLNIFARCAPPWLWLNQQILPVHTQIIVHKMLPIDTNSIYLLVALSLWLIIFFVSFGAFLYKYWLVTRDLQIGKNTFVTKVPNRRFVRTAYCDKVTGPGVFGLFRPALVLPSNFHTQFSPLQQELILEHELIHIQRRDNILNFIWLFSCCLFWFNPLSYLAWRIFRLDQELSCDFLTLQQRSNEEKVSYGELIVAVSNRQNLTPMYCGIHSSFNQTKERIVMLKTTLKPKTSRITGIALMCIYASGSFVLAQNEIIDEDNIRYVINNLDVLKHQNEGPLIMDSYKPFNSADNSDYLLGIWDEKSPQRVAVRFDTERAVSGELLTTVNIDSYKNHQNRESRKFTFVGDDVPHSITFAENEITDQVFKIDFEVQQIKTDSLTLEEQQEQFSNQQKNNRIVYNNAQ